MDLTTRNRNIISGLIALVLLFSSIVVGVRASFGEFDDIYTLKAHFSNAGQGLQKGSDVKIRGVNVGKVQSVRLDTGQALVTMEIHANTKVPQTATATVRPKTLFGEKFVDVAPGDGEANGPYYGKGGEFLDKCDKSKEQDGTCAHGGFELERVLGDAYPLLKQINPAELMTVINTLAEGGRDLGPAVNRQLVNGEKVLDVMAAHDADTRRFLTDLATLSNQLGVRAEDLVAAANDLDVALPTINSRADKLNALLQQTARLSNDVADLLLNNQDFIDKSFNGGQAVLDTVYDRRNNLVPLVVGLRQYLQTLTEIIRIPVGDGTMMGAVKSLTATNVCEVFGTCVTSFNATSATASPPGVNQSGGALDQQQAGGITGEISSDLGQVLAYFIIVGGQ